jgi:putative inorganic carbon (hco3(-)) transporter
VAIAAWAAFAFAGTYAWTLAPLAAAALALAIIVRPAIADRGEILGGALFCCLSLTAVQLLPLPAPVRSALSPNRAAVEAQLVFAPAATGPLTLDPAATARALAVGIALFLIFLSARALFERQEGLRTVCRGIAWIGLLLATEAFIQRAVSPASIYGLWRPPGLASNILPWGPFINRNDFAAWLLMAIPLTIGYVLMRMSSRQVSREARIDADRFVDSRLILLLASTCVMTGAILASLSRSGALSLAIALMAFMLIARTRLGRTRLSLLAASVGLLLLVGGFYVNLPALVTRMNEAWPSGLGGRLAVWRETWPIVRDFAGTGVGVGAYAQAMLVYQQSSRLMFFNHAHNEFLQIITEGGVVLGIAAALALVIAVRRTTAMLRHDRSPVFWARAGAACGLFGVGCQSVWDTALRMPANAVLFAILAAVALHRPGRDPESGPPLTSGR